MGKSTFINFTYQLCVIMFRVVCTHMDRTILQLTAKTGYKFVLIAPRSDDFKFWGDEAQSGHQ